MKTSQELERQAALDVAAFMAAAARTAPKTRGIDNISVLVVDDTETKNLIILKMKEISKRNNLPTFDRDANSISNAHALVVISVVSNAAGLNCGCCGHKTCDGLEAVGGVCAFNSIDLGIAIASAAAIASQFHMDNRIMYSVAYACIELKFFGESVKQALAVPLSVTGKNPFFDRK
jgi:uncharacterized ferredoxin-like protein